MTTANPDQTKGRALEQRVRDALRLHGYDADSNVHVTGRSGARHEFDVVGEKSDGLTRYRLVVECKAWTRPIDKDVVYKLSGELADVGAARGVIVAPAGWTAQAAAVASQLHIDLWGAEELAARLPPLGEGSLSPGRSPVVAPGLPFAIAPEAGRQEVDRSARGRLGHRGEAVAWFGAAWLPVWVLELGLSRRRGMLNRVDSVTRVWNEYEALDGTLVQTSNTEPHHVPVDIGEHPLRLRLDQKKMSARITDAAGRWERASHVGVRGSDASFQRRLGARDTARKGLAALGVDAPVDHLSVDSATLAYRPLWLGILTRGPHQRVLAIDAAGGQPLPAISDILTAHAQWVRQSLGAPSTP